MTESVPAASTSPGSPTDSDDRGTAVVVAGGEGFSPSMLRRLPPHHAVYAADSGLDVARAAGIEVDVVVGDLDSVTPEALAAAQVAGTTIERHPADKDHTDLDLALSRAATDGFSRCFVLGGGGGRLSHLLGNAAVVAADRHAHLDIVWVVGAAEVRIARPGHDVEVAGLAGGLVSLLAVGERATGVTTTGMRWRLLDDVLEAGSTRGISNRLTGSAASVSVTGGALFVIAEPEATEVPS